MASADSMVFTGASFVLSVAAVLAFLRLLRGPTLPDRIVALDNLSFQVIALVVVHAVEVGEPELLSVGVVLAAIVFLGTVAFARYIEAVAARAPGAPPDEVVPRRDGNRG